jgi:hypothetical protein
MRLVKAAATALDIVELQCTIKPLPKVRILHGHHLPEELPPPVAAPPFRKAISNARPHIIATVDKRHARRLIERLQSANDGQQIEPFDGQIRFGVVGFEALRAILAAQSELPFPAATAAVNVRDQEKVGGIGYHRMLSFAM